MKVGLPSTIARFLSPLLAAAALTFAAPAQAAGGGEFPLDHFPESKLTDLAALQNGAKLFVNYCLGCHSLGAMRYNRLSELGLSDDQIRDNLMFTGEKVGDRMTIAMQAEDAKAWFGALPPDLSVTARSRSSHAGSGADWIYTFLRTFYRDETRATGWNNAVFPAVGMPNVLWSLQGTRPLSIIQTKATGDGHAAGDFTKQVTVHNADGSTTHTEAPVGEHPHVGTVYEFGQAQGGTMDRLAFDDAVADLTAFLTYVSEPTAKLRTRLGVWVLVFLGILFVAALMLNRAYWKDIR